MTAATAAPARSVLADVAAFPNRIVRGLVKAAFAGGVTASAWRALLW
jgi:hypothetical protein